jgi:large subunit ribosomal protein L35
LPKLKTHKGAKRRFHVTGSGKIMQTKGNKSHLRRRKSRRAKALFSEMIEVHPTARQRLRRLLPYKLR